MEPRGCQVSEAGLTFTVDGQPSITIVSDWSNDDGRLREDGKADGTLAWELDDRAGSCLMELTFVRLATTRDEPSATTFDGMLCGHVVNNLGLDA